MVTTTVAKKNFLLASYFDQTLSYNDSGVVLSELIGATLMFIGFLLATSSAPATITAEAHS